MQVGPGVAVEDTSTPMPVPVSAGAGVTLGPVPGVRAVDGPRPASWTARRHSTSRFNGAQHNHELVKLSPLKSYYTVLEYLNEKALGIELLANQLLDWLQKYVVRGPTGAFRVHVEPKQTHLTWSAPSIARVVAQSSRLRSHRAATRFYHYIVSDGTRATGCGACAHRGVGEHGAGFGSGSAVGGATVHGGGAGCRSRSRRPPAMVQGGPAARAPPRAMFFRAASAESKPRRAVSPLGIPKSPSFHSGLDLVATVDARHKRSDAVAELARAFRFALFAGKAEPDMAAEGPPRAPSPPAPAAPTPALATPPSTQDKETAMIQLPPLKGRPPAVGRRGPRRYRPAGGRRGRTPVDMPPLVYNIWCRGKRLIEGEWDGVKKSGPPELSFIGQNATVEAINSRLFCESVVCCRSSQPSLVLKNESGTRIRREIDTKKRNGIESQSEIEIETHTRIGIKINNQPRSGTEVVKSIERTKDIILI
ncbi:hypothetical protein EVAR_91686_1 [Eumeta japonica]|uniref:Uncharacterized protein n=1 Tax=Eumeta variegata TaxID=151549 RepID=A0A4C1ZFT9_EUMVA|nr:hypothetical protein EVAR_91686_1 [Eumeta japonica]